MVPVDTIVQNALLILRDPAWQAVGIIASSTLSLFAIFHTQSSETIIVSTPILKKNLMTVQLF